MLRSMTGFGAAAAKGSGAEARVEIRSVNHRHLQVKSRLPQSLTHLEPQIEAAVRAKLSRGSVTVGVDLERERGAGARIDERALRAWCVEIQRATRAAGLEAEFGLETVLGLPGVLVAGDGDARARADERLVLAALGAALESLDTMRAREGRALAADLKKHGQAIRGVAKRLEKRLPKLVQEQHAALRRRLADLLEGAPGARLPKEADLARELALLADKTDVAEELTRLASHLAQLDALVASGTPAGRPLDFLVQELFREANTIGSKCNDAQAAHLVVELKTLVERLREQVQNVE
ncbi:MAG: YicC family protein [Planctomycetes bacterium]|nr:YicC family protein [Planctomycetota bacterium]